MAAHINIIPVAITTDGSGDGSATVGQTELVGFFCGITHAGEGTVTVTTPDGENLLGSGDDSDYVAAAGGGAIPVREVLTVTIAGGGSEVAHVVNVRAVSGA
jgi:hypothetical protein